MPDSLQPHGLQPTRLLCPWYFSRQGYWSGLPFPSPGNLPDPGIKPLVSYTAGRFFTTWATREATKTLQLFLIPQRIGLKPEWYPEADSSIWLHCIQFASSYQGDFQWRWKSIDFYVHFILGGGDLKFSLFFFYQVPNNNFQFSQLLTTELILKNPFRDPPSGLVFKTPELPLLGCGGHRTRELSPQMPHAAKK